MSGPSGLARAWPVSVRDRLNSMIISRDVHDPYAMNGGMLISSYIVK
jgi:hypothetical protein